MRIHIKKIIVILAALTVLSLFAFANTQCNVVFAAESVASGSCGDTAEYKIISDGTLIISGSGNVSSTPWNDNYHSFIKNIIIEEGITSIGVSFQSASLISVKLPESLLNLGGYTFSNCDYLRSIDLPDNLRIIGDLTFINCSGLEQIDLPDHLEEIGTMAFAGCCSLTSITIPDSVNIIGREAFSNCGALSDVIMSDKLMNSCDIGDVFNNTVYFGKTGNAKGGIGSVIWSISPSGILYFNGTGPIEVNGGWVGYRYLINDINIAEGISEIVPRALDSLHEVTTISIPLSMKIIDENALSNCPSLSEIHYAGDKDSWEQIDIDPSNDTLLTAKIYYDGCLHSNGFIVKGVIEKSCTYDGYTGDKYCPDCEELIEIGAVIPAEGHSWNEEPTVDKTETCVEEGSQSIHCSVCDAIDESTVKIIPKTDHKYGEWATTKEATCIESGSKERVCSECGNTVAEVMPAMGHLWNYNYTEDQSATCVNEGSESIHCSACDAIDESTVKIIPKTEHKYGDWITTIEETCTKDGGKEKICAYCGDKITEVIFAAGHTWNEELTVDKEVTYTEEGSESIHCSICNEIKEGSLKVIARLRKPVNLLDISGISTKTYTGKELTQELTIKDDATVLTNGVDYTVSYKNNINAGTATVTITGKENYTGTKTATFKINQAPQFITVKAAASPIVIGKTTTVSLTGAKGTKSFKSSDTTIAAVDSKTGKVTAKKVGTVKITATSAAIANYKAATKMVTIRVVPAATAILKADDQASGIKLTWSKVTGANGYKIYRGENLIKTITSGSTVTFADAKANTNGTKYTYKVVAKASTGDSTLSKSITVYKVARPAISAATNSAASKITVKWGRNAKANGYQIQYSTSKTFASGTKAATVASASTVSKVIGSLTKGKTYYVRIRTYKTVGSSKYWSAWSVVKSVKVAK